MNNVSLRAYVERLFKEHHKLHRTNNQINERRLRKLETRSDFVTVSVYEAKHQALSDDVEEAADRVEQRLVIRNHDIDGRIRDQANRIASLENFRSKAGLIATGLVILGGILGASIVKLLGGG